MQKNLMALQEGFETQIIKKFILIIGVKINYIFIIL